MNMARQWQLHVKGKEERLNGKKWICILWCEQIKMNVTGKRKPGTIIEMQRFSLTENKYDADVM